MRKEYIERGTLLKKSETMHDGQRCCLAVKEGYIYTAPAADVVEVVHGWWAMETLDKKNRKTSVACSECEAFFSLDLFDFGLCYNYCPNCGAKMDGERKEV